MRVLNREQAALFLGHAGAHATGTMVRLATRRRWNEACMSEADKDRVRKLLQDRVRTIGLLTEDNADSIVKYRTLATRFQDPTGPQPADVAWSWIAEQKHAVTPSGCEGIIHPLLERMSPGATDEFSSPIPRWEWYAMVISGWRRLEDNTVETVALMRLTDKVLVTLVREEEGMGWP